MGQMAAYASGFFWDIMNQWAAWGPLAANLQQDLETNTKGMTALREKAAQTLQDIECLERLMK
jgi:hypothetical protein